MWAIFRLNVLSAMVTGKFKNNPDKFAEFYAEEYDRAIKSGGDLLYGVNVINGNVKGMADAIKIAFKKGTDSVGSNFNILQEIYPAAFDAYWQGAEMSPLPNPLIKPGGWPTTPPAPGTIQNIGPDPITLATTKAAHKAEKEALQKLEDELKKIEVTIPGTDLIPDIVIPLYETAQKIINDEAVLPSDEKSEEFYNELKNYFNRPDATVTDRAKWYAFQKLNEQYGYAPVAIRSRTIVGKRSITNPFSGRLNLVAEENPTYGEIRPFAERLLDMYLMEYGHYVQLNQNEGASKLQKASNFVGDLLGDYTNMIKNSKGLNLKKAYDINYDTPGTLEYDAHKVIQPELQAKFDKNVQDYIISNIRELTTGQSPTELDLLIRNNPMVKNAIDVIKKLKEAKKKKPSIGKQFKKALKFEFPKLPDRQKIIEETKEKLLEQAIEEIKQQIIPPIEDVVLQPVYQYIQTAVALLDSIPNPKPTLPQIKKFVKDTINGIKPEIELPGIEIPNIPTKEDFEKQLEQKTPTEEEIKALAEDKIKGLIPDIPFINIIPPTFIWSAKTNIMIDPFITLSQIHLAGVGGNMSVTAQYSPPAPPAPAIINYTGYQVKNGPSVPDFPSTVDFPEVDLGSIELPKFPELPELPQLSVVDIASSLTISLPNIEVKTPNIEVKTPNLPNVG